MTYEVVVIYANGSKSVDPFDSYSKAIEYCRSNISYTGGRVQRVEIHERSVRTIWNKDWDAISKHAGLWT